MDQQTQRTEEKKEQEEAERIRLQKEKEEAEGCALEETKQAKILKKQLEDKIRQKVLAEKKQKEDEAAAKEVARLEKLEKFQIENRIRAEQGMELLIIPPELLDKSVPSEIKCPEEIKKENHIQKVPLETPTKQSGLNQETVSNEIFSTPPAKTFVSVAESVKRKIIPDDGATPPKKAKKVKCRQCNVFIAQSEIAQHKEDYHQPELVNTRCNLRQCNNTGKVVSS